MNEPLHIGKIVRNARVFGPGPAEALYPAISLPAGDLDRVALYETDILMLMARQKVDVEPLFAELRAHLSPTDLASLRGITDEIRQRIERFGGQFR